jgi:hypothetical protein
MKLVRMIVTLTAACLMSACGLIFNGSRQSIQVQSAPVGATVQTAPSSGTFTTPTTLNLQRKNSYVLTFTKEGYSAATFNIENSTKVGIVVLDVLFTGLIGVVVDAATGAWYALSPEAATVSLTRTTALGDGLDTIHISVGQSPDRRTVEVTSDVPAVQVQIQVRP